MYHQAKRFAFLEVHLLYFVKKDTNFDNSIGKGARKTLVLLTYLALFFCLGAVISGHILTYRRPMDLQAPQERGLIQDGFSDGGPLDRLQNHEVKHTWVQVGVMWHCECFAFIIKLYIPFLTTDRRGVLRHRGYCFIYHAGAVIGMAGRA